MAFPYQSEIFPKSTPQPNSLLYGENDSGFSFQNSYSPAVAPGGFLNQFSNFISPYLNSFRVGRLGNPNPYQVGLAPTSTRNAQDSRPFPTMTPTPEQMGNGAQGPLRLPSVTFANASPSFPSAQFKKPEFPQRKQYFLPSVYRYDGAQSSGSSQTSSGGSSSAYPFSYMEMPNGAPQGYSSNAPANAPANAPTPAPSLQIPEGSRPFAWSAQPNWTWSPGGTNPFSGVPEKNLTEAMWNLDSQLPWAQMYYANQARGFEEEMLQNQFGASRQDAAFNQWLQSQDFARQGDQFNRQFDAGRDDTRWNQGFQQQQFDTQNNQFDRQFDAGRDDTRWNQGFQQQQFDTQNDQFNRQFDADRSDTRWNQGFQQMQFDTQTGQWTKQFDAGRDDAMWNRGFQDKQFDLQNRDFERQGSQWNQQFAAGRDDASWNRGMQEKDWNRSGQQWQDQFGQQANQWRNEFDFQKKNAEEQNRLAEQAQYVGAFGRRFAPASGSM